MSARHHQHDSIALQFRYQISLRGLTPDHAASRRFLCVARERSDVDFDPQSHPASTKQHQQHQAQTPATIQCDMLSVFFYTTFITYCVCCSVQDFVVWAYFLETRILDSLWDFILFYTIKTDSDLACVGRVIDLLNANSGCDTVSRTIPLCHVSSYSYYTPIIRHPAT